MRLGVDDPERCVQQLAAVEARDCGTAPGRGGLEFHGGRWVEACARTERWEKPATLAAMANAIALRDLERRDQPRVRRLILEGLREHWSEIDESLNADLDDIALSYIGGRTVIALLVDEVIGTGTVVPRDASTAEIVRMSVASSYRRSGVGRALVEELIRTARTWSSRRVVLETTSTWTGTIDFYLACGFRITGLRNGELGEDTWFELQL